MGAIPASPDFTALVPVQASVMFLRLREFASLSVAEQALQRQRLTKLVASLVPLWREDARVVLEGIDGAAIIGLDNPALALQAAQQATAHAGLGIGLHHGPLQLVEVDGITQVKGDGIETAQAIAALPEAQPLAATREFRQALFLASPGGADVLRPAGNYVDDRLRSHELYAPDPDAARARRLRRMLLGGTALAGILGVGVVAGVGRRRYEAARRPAAVQLDIRPVGEIWLDGEFKGFSPPLTRISVAPGRHTIEIVNGRAKPLLVNLQLKPGEELQLRHAFAAPAPAQRSEAKQEPAPVRKLREWADQIKDWTQ